MNAQKLYADKFNKGNIKKAHTELEKRLQGTKENKRYLFCLFIGIVLSFIFFYVIIKHIDGKIQMILLSLSSRFLAFLI